MKSPNATSPDELLKLAKAEPRKMETHALWPHRKAIVLLYDEKKMSFRRMAKWFEPHGLKFSYTYFHRVYRAVKAGDIETKN